MRKDYVNRVKNFHPEFKKDILETTLRIHKKDGKAFPLRIWKSVRKRWKSVYRYKITLVLNYYEYLGVLEKRLENVTEYKARMERYTGLFERGGRRVYFSPRNDLSNPQRGDVVPYEKLSYKELGKQITQIEEYPV